MKKRMRNFCPKLYEKVHLLGEGHEICGNLLQQERELPVTDSIADFPECIIQLTWDDERI